MAGLLFSSLFIAGPFAKYSFVFLYFLRLNDLKRRHGALTCQPNDLIGRILEDSALLTLVNPDFWIRHEVGLQLSHDIVAEQLALQVAFS